MAEPMTVTLADYALPASQGDIHCHGFGVGKRIMDILLGFVALVLAVPILALSAAIIKYVSKGAVFYSQMRVGKNGKLFRMYKIRTMTCDAESESGPVWASELDPRVLPGCRWMRQSHIDELPQLINVLKGEMSLVGPRPERPEIVAELEKSYPEFNQRLAVRPGITGLAQVRNGYDKTVDSVRHKLNYDMEYIAKRKWSVELLILAATLPKFYDKATH